MALVRSIDISEIVDDCAYGVLGKSQFYVGLEKCIGDLRGMLLDKDVSVVGAQSMGGGGKTFLALGICNDPQIKEYFHENVAFITVSQSPNLIGILETMWEKIGGRKKQEFQNLEDGHKQLQQLILRQPKSTLVILDDVWSRIHLENLLFEGPGYKTVVTTRDRSNIPTTQTTRLYQLPLLCKEDALSLFCFWAFGRTSIPSTVDANLVKEIMNGGMMPRKEASWPEKWEMLNHRACDVQLLSIQTGPMEAKHWFQMNFRETEALLLFFTSNE
ncbi:hypothetical protein SUGI_0362020 [Cryptomeria japonica]|nr:hypothetical protein SUGI_0362020 [Cryptomeria japonica]